MKLDINIQNSLNELSQAIDRLIAENQTLRQEIDRLEDECANLEIDLIKARRGVE